MQWSVRPRPDVLPTDREFVNIAFFDAYFSNFIEGTKFQVGEVREIGFEGKIPAGRPREAHYAQEHACRSRGRYHDSLRAESESPRLIGSASTLLCDLLSRGVRLALWRGKMLRALHQRRTVAPRPGHHGARLRCAGDAHFLVRGDH